VRDERIELTDLAHPVFPEPMRETIEMIGAAGAGLELDPDVLMAAATAETGLDDFGDSWFRTPLEVVCTAYREQGGLSATGRTMTWAQLHSMLKNRLLVEHYVAEHPEVLDIEIARPIVIAGLPRTGTTHLHNMLSADPALRHLPYWESLEPLLPLTERGVTPDPRIERAAAGLEIVNGAMPNFAAMHEMTAEHVHEEIQLLALTFSTMFFETLAPTPMYRDWWDSTDQRPAYGYLKRILQVLQHARGGKRWVLKSPQHLAQLPAVMATFPDATVVLTHRDPVAVTVSMATMGTYTARLQLDPIDPIALGKYWSGRVEHLLTSCGEHRDNVPADQSIDVRFADYMANEAATVEAIYNRADQPLTTAALAAMDAFRASHPRGRHGTIAYRARPLGIDIDERRAALRHYSERFGVIDEVVMT